MAFFFFKNLQKYRVSLNIKVVRLYDHDCKFCIIPPAILKERRKAGKTAFWGDLEKSEKWADRK